MPNPMIDFSEVKSLEPVPAGVYAVVITEAKPGMSQTQNPKIDVRYRIEGGEMDGRTIFDTISFAPNALWRAKNTLQGLGFAKDFSGEVTAEDLVDRTAMITVTIETSEGTNPTTGEPYGPRNRVTKVGPIEGASLSTLFKG